MESNYDNGYERYFSIVESLLFVSGDPLNIETIAGIIECSKDFAEKILKEMASIYEKDESRGLRIICVNDGYQMATKSVNSDFIQMLLHTNVRQSLSRAALETLSIIAYKQPITRVEIEEIRGVKSDRAISTLAEKGLIRECGKKNVIGRPNLYGTTDEFLRHFDFESLDQLPSLESFLGDEEIVDNEE